MQIIDIGIAIPRSNTMVTNKKVLHCNSYYRKHSAVTKFNLWNNGCEGKYDTNQY